MEARHTISFGGVPVSPTPCSADDDKGALNQAWQVVNGQDALTPTRTKQTPYRLDHDAPASRANGRTACPSGRDYDPPSGAVITIMINRRLSARATESGAIPGMRDKFLFALVALWAMLQIAPFVPGHPNSLDSALLMAKNLAPIPVVLLTPLLHFRRVRISPLLVPAVLLTFYSLLVSLASFSKISDISTPMMYGIWSIYLFVCMPTMCRDKRQLLVFLRYLVYATCSILLVSILLALVLKTPLGQVYPGGNRGSAFRYSFTFGNPGYFGSVAISVAFGSWAIYTLSRHQADAVFGILLSLLVVGGLILADARASMLATLAAGVFVALFNSHVAGRRAGGVVLASIVAVSLTLLALSALWLLWGTSSSAVLSAGNYYSSGRTTMWVRELTEFADHPINLLFGNGVLEPRWLSAVLLADGKRIISPFQTYKLDSSYLQIVGLYGLAGLGMFLAVFVGLFGSLWRRARQRSVDSATYSLALGAVAGIAAMGFVQSIVPSLGNLLDVIVLGACASVATWHPHPVPVAQRATKGGSPTHGVAHV